MKMKGVIAMKDDRYIERPFVCLEAIPQSITCPKCGGEIGLWTDSILTICWFCGYRVFEKEAIIN